MRTNTISTKVTLLIATLFFFIAPLSIQAAEWELNFQSIYGANHQIHLKYFEPWTKSFAEKSNGELVMHLFPNSTLVDMMEAPKAIKSGMLDSGGWGTSSDFQDFSYSMLYSLPFLVDNSVHGTELYWQLYKEIPELKKQMDSVGQLLFQFSNTRSALFSINSPVTTPADIKGKRVIIINPGDSEDIKSWGGTPVFLPFTDVYVGLQRGMGDILFCQIPMAISLRIQEIAKYMTPIMTHAVNMTGSINQDLFNEMPVNIQELIMNSSGEEFSKKLAFALDQDLADSLTKFKDANCQIHDLTPEELQLFEKSLENQLTTFWIAKMKEYGIKDAEALSKKAYAISESIKQ